MMRSNTYDVSHCSYIYYTLQSDYKLPSANYAPLEECWRYLRGEIYGVHYSDSRVVISLLLILAGDIEVNPGPGEYHMHDYTVSCKHLAL